MHTSRVILSYALVVVTVRGLDLGTYISITENTDRDENISANFHSFRPFREFVSFWKNDDFRSGFPVRIHDVYVYITNSSIVLRHRFARVSFVNKIILMSFERLCDRTTSCPLGHWCGGKIPSPLRQTTTSGTGKTSKRAAVFCKELSGDRRFSERYR